MYHRIILITLIIRSCLQNLALTATRQDFLCPNCGEGEAWLDQMLVAGLYVPDQDRLQLERLCDAKLCFCPEETGRAHTTRDGPWQILRCQACGLQVRKLADYNTGSFSSLTLPGDPCQVRRTGQSAGALLALLHLQTNPPRGRPGGDHQHTNQ